MSTHINDLIANRKLSRTQACIIAKSQRDLGGVSKEDMIIALAGPRTLSDGAIEVIQRINAFYALDELSQYIVRTFLESESIEDALHTMRYAESCISAVTRAEPFFEDENPGSEFSLHNCKVDISGSCNGEELCPNCGQSEVYFHANIKPEQYRRASDELKNK